MNAKTALEIADSIQVLQRSERGQNAALGLYQFLDQYASGLDLNNQQAIRNLMHHYWNGSTSAVKEMLLQIDDLDTDEVPPPQAGKVWPTNDPRRRPGDLPFEQYEITVTATGKILRSDHVNEMAAIMILGEGATWTTKQPKDPIHRSRLVFGVTLDLTIRPPH